MSAPGGFHSPADVHFVTPDVYREHCREHFRLDTYFTDECLARALTLAADPDGLILRFNHADFYKRHMSAALRSPEDPEDWTLDFSRFVYVCLQDGLDRMVRYGLLGYRGNGDSFDYRLALPVRLGRSE